MEIGPNLRELLEGVVVAIVVSIYFLCLFRKG